MGVMYYIVGLGNPGEEYAYTRHNVGWLALDAVCAQGNLPSSQQQNAMSGRVSNGVISGAEVAVLYPDTFMNNSGSAVRKFVPKSDIKNLVVLYDDVDLPLGEIKVSFGRGSGGHNGIESIIKSTGSKDFIRVRIGIAKTSFWPWEKGQIKRPKGGEALERHVLGVFSKREEEGLKQSVTKTVSAVSMILTEGHAAAMNKYN
jgi:PTH1 family peptidyl-tRNA hydrolase